jgi:glutamyl-tRNA synthetase
MNVRVRFAPSPTGYLHIGGARTALFNWLYARHTGGTFVLRIEDTDVARSTDEATQVIFESLKWLGIDWDEGPLTGGDYGPYFQSQRREIYQRRIQELKDKGFAYEHEGAIKFRMKREPVTVPDLICGNVTRTLSEAEMMNPDFVIVRSDGNPVFHLVNVIDDLEMKITHVIRGEDHLSNTPKHLALFEAFGVAPPHYAHIPLILNTDGTKMSKRDRGASMTTYMEDGYLPEAVRNYLCLLGWSPKNNEEILPIDEIIRRFDLPQIKRHNARFDIEKLFWIQSQYVMKMLPDDYFRTGKTWLRKKGVITDSVAEDYLRGVLSIVQEKVKLFSELPAWTSFFFAEDFPIDPEAFDKTAKQPNVAVLLTKLRERFAAAEPFAHDELEKALKALAAELGVKTGALIHPCRVAVSGKTVGPSLFHMLAVLGKERVLARMESMIQRLAGTNG